MNKTPDLDLVAAARKRLARLRHWRAVARAGGDATASVNRAEWKAAQARDCLRALGKAAAQRGVGANTASMRHLEAKAAAQRGVGGAA